MSKTNWFSTLKNSNGTSADILIYDEIGGWGITAKAFIEAVKSLGVETLNLHINSPGGDVFEGIAIYNFLRTYKGKVTAYVDGLAASIASIILLGADERIMAENAMVMIHNPFAMAAGDGDDMRRMAEAMDKISEAIVTTYSSRTNLSAAQARDLMENETWLSAEECKANGFCTAISGKLQIAASFDLSKFRNPPKAFAKAETQTVTNKNKMENTYKEALVKLGVITASVADADAISQIETRFSALAGLEAKAKADAEKITALEAKVSGFEASRLEAIVTAAIEEGKIKADQKDAYINLLKLDEKSTKAVIENLVIVPAMGAAPLNQGAAKTETESKFEQFQKITDAKERGEFYAKHKDEILGK